MGVSQLAYIFVPMFFMTGMAISWAEEPPPMLSPLEILELIEANGDHAFAVAGADISIAQARLEQAKSALYPSLTLNSTGQIYRSTQKSNDNAEIYSALEVAKPIYDFGKKGVGIAKLLA